MGEEEGGNGYGAFATLRGSGMERASSDDVTTIVYDPAGPELRFSGHAGAGAPGRDLVCAALSTLLYTLIAAEPEAAVELGEGSARVRGGDGGAYAVVAAGLRLLAAEYPRHVRMEVRT